MTTDYVALSAYLHAREPLLLNEERREQMLYAQDAEEALRVLEECGYPLPAAATQSAVEKMLAESRAALYDELRAMAPEDPAAAVFSARYDYHNAKVWLKAVETEEEAERLFMAGGRFSADTLRYCFEHDDFRPLTSVLAEGIAAARAELRTSGSAQRADIALDRAYFEELRTLAAADGFLAGYVSLLIDTTNLRTLVRVTRRHEEETLLPFALFDGGTILPQRLSEAGAPLAEICRGSTLERAGTLADKLRTEGGPLTDFERACDDALGAWFDAARRTVSGEEVVAYYLFAREAEWTAIRTIVSGRLAGLDAEAIRSRLRGAYC